jgi:two-component system sensor histidine kinase KdpD
MNVQHLESLKGLVQRSTGVVVREIVPDSFLTQAAQIVNVDVSIEDLIERLRSGKIYGPEKMTAALENFFRDENLTTLRELALREVAESVERGSGAPGRRPPPDRLGTDRGRVMVCMSSYPPHALALLRRGSRAAGRLNTDWFVVYVETDRESPDRIDSEAQRHLMGNIELARELGATVVRVKGTDPVDTILDFARAHGIGLIIMGRSHQPWYKRLFGSVPARLVRKGSEFDVQIVAMPDEGGAR